MLETLRTNSEFKLIALVVNLRIRNPKIPEVEKYDPVSCPPNEIGAANPWTGSWGLSDPRLIHVLADLKTVNKRWVKKHDKCEAAGKCGEWLEWEK
ncbi:MAG: hypothetical protein Q9175_005683 [Cornicularia normoerica]